MTETTCKDDVVLWQETEGIPQPALLIEFFDECITITQENKYISLNYESVNELCKVLKSRKP